jgi:hypothetical protein
VYIAASEKQPDWVADTIDKSMDFCVLSAAGNANILVRFRSYSPFFAPAACWCTLVLVLSSDMSCISASIVKISNIFSITPASDHLANLSYSVLHDP